MLLHINSPQSVVCEVDSVSGSLLIHRSMEHESKKRLLDSARASVKEANNTPDLFQGRKSLQGPPSCVLARIHQSSRPRSPAGESTHGMRLLHLRGCRRAPWSVSVNGSVAMTIFPVARVREDGPGFTVMSKSEGITGPQQS